MKVQRREGFGLITANTAKAQTSLSTTLQSYQRLQVTSRAERFGWMRHEEGGRGHNEGGAGWKSLFLKQRRSRCTSIETENQPFLMEMAILAHGVWESTKYSAPES
jgi:hypothetical protein